MAVHGAGLLAHVVCAVLRSSPTSRTAWRALTADLAPLVLLSSFCVCSAVRAHSEGEEEVRGGRAGQRLLPEATARASLRRLCWSFPIRSFVAASMVVHSCRGWESVGGLTGEWVRAGSSSALLTLSLALLALLSFAS